MKRCFWGERKSFSSFGFFMYKGEVGFGSLRGNKVVRELEVIGVYVNSKGI